MRCTPGRPARDHLLSVAQSNGISGRRVEEVLGLTGLSSVANRRARTYSLGMKQRAGDLGRASRNSNPDWHAVRIDVRAPPASWRS